MARILYGVHGTGHGHAMRGLTIARALPQHDFLFVADDDAPGVLEPEFPVARIPNLGTVFKNYHVDFGATVARAIPLLLQQKKYVRAVAKLIEDYKPDICMADLEYFTPRAAKMLGLPCLTLDHQHIITCCAHRLPANMWWDTFIQGLTPRLLFCPTEANILISFYAPPVLPLYCATVCPPILRDTVIRQQSRDEGHILVYQSNSTDRRLIDFLKNSGRTAYVFGYDMDDGKDGNVIFRPRSETEFLERLAGCSYVIQGGSHTLMSEALYLGKPILSLPLQSMVEQRFNAFYLEKSGYGLQASMGGLSPSLLRKFEDGLDTFKNNMSKVNFLGNDLVFNMVDHFAHTGKLQCQGVAAS